MPERLSTTTEAPRVDVDEETIAEIDAVGNEARSQETSPETGPSVTRLSKAREQVRQLLEAHDARQSVDEAPHTPEQDNGVGPEASPEKKSFKRTKNLLRKVGNWAVTSLEANGWIARRGTWHNQDGPVAFIAKAYVWAKNRKAQRTEGFLSAEASRQLNGETPEEADTHESDGDDHEDESKLKQARRRLGRIALTAARRTKQAPKKAYRTWKAIKNTK